MPLSLRTFTVILESEADGGYSVHCPALPGCVSQGDDRQAALANVKEAIGLVLEVSAPEAAGHSRGDTPARIADALRGVLEGREQDGRPFAEVFLAQVSVNLEDVEDCRMADGVMERVRRGQERIYSTAEVMANLGLDG